MIDDVVVLHKPDRSDHPKNDHPKISPWLDEQIWGHRLYDSQSPWLLFLEFMSVAQACHREGRLFDEKGKHYPLTYQPYKRMALRNILFNNEVIFQIDERHPDSETAWDEWLKWMKARAQDVPDRDFSYLKSRFESFHEFTLLVGLLKSSAVESTSNKRWTSRFVFPFGPNALYEDLGISPSGTTNRQYINFGRTGELLYLMLCRASAREELKQHLGMFFNENNSWNKLLGLLQPEGKEEMAFRGKSYLPYLNHPIFDEMCKDWLSVFRIQLPGFDGFSHLVTLSSLYVMLYQLHVAAMWAGHERKPHFICEVVAPRKTSVRDLSFSSYAFNNALSLQAVLAYIHRVKESEEWQKALQEPDSFLLCKQILMEHFWWGEKTPTTKKYEGPNNPEALLEDLKSEALQSHRQYAGNVHRNYGRGIGLISKRGTTKMRYAPTDTLLKTLVLTNVRVRMELSLFLEQIYHRYGFVFGEREAELVLKEGDFDKKPFQANAHRLEQRLSSLGMLRRLSDSCAYVENPYSRR